MLLHLPSRFETKLCLNFFRKLLTVQQFLHFIHSLFHDAKEILENGSHTNFQKVYDQTLTLFEQLILIKNLGELRKDLWQELESKYDNAIDSKKNDHQNQSPLKNVVKDIIEEIHHNKTFEAQLTDTTLQGLTFEPKEELTTQKEVVKELSLIHI